MQRRDALHGRLVLSTAICPELSTTLHALSTTGIFLYNKWELSWTLRFPQRVSTNIEAIKPWDMEFGTKIAFFIKTRTSKLAIIDKSARRIYNERPKRSYKKSHKLH